MGAISQFPWGAIFHLGPLQHAGNHNKLSIHLQKILPSGVLPFSRPATPALGAKVARSAFLCCCLPSLAHLALRLTTSPARLLLMDAATPLAVSQCHAWQILRPNPCKLGFCALVPEGRAWTSPANTDLSCAAPWYRIPIAISSFLILVVFPRLPNFESFDWPRSVLHSEMVRAWGPLALRVGYVFSPFLALHLNHLISLGWRKASISPSDFPFLLIPPFHSFHPLLLGALTVSFFSSCFILSF